MALPFPGHLSSASNHLLIQLLSRSLAQQFRSDRRASEHERSLDALQSLFARINPIDSVYNSGHWYHGGLR